MFTDNNMRFVLHSFSLISFLFVVDVLAADQNIENGKCNVQIQGENNTIIFSGCEESTEAQRLQKLLEEVLREVRVSLIREKQMVFPAMETFLNDPTEINWKKVTWAANESLEQIRTGIDKSLQYDAEMANSSAKARTLVEEANRNANKPFFNQFQVIRQEWNIRAFTKGQFAAAEFQGKRIPTKEQAKAWHSDLQAVYVALDKELTKILHQLAMSSANSEMPNK